MATKVRPVATKVCQVAAKACTVAAKARPVAIKAREVAAKARTVNYHNAAPPSVQLAGAAAVFSGLRTSETQKL